MFRIFFVLFISGLVFILGAILIQLIELYRKRTQFKDRIQSVISFGLILLNENQLEMKSILENIKDLKNQQENPSVTEENKIKAEILLNEFENENIFRNQKQLLLDEILKKLNIIQKNYILSLDMQEKKSDLDKLRKKDSSENLDKELIRQWKSVDALNKALTKIKNASTEDQLKSVQIPG
jgi:hypothetical protein